MSDERKQASAARYHSPKKRVYKAAPNNTAHTTAPNNTVRKTAHNKPACKTTLNKLASVFFSFVLAASMFPTQAFAEGALTISSNSFAHETDQSTEGASAAQFASSQDAGENEAAGGGSSQADTANKEAGLGTTEDAAMHAADDGNSASQADLAANIQSTLDAQSRADALAAEVLAADFDPATYPDANFAPLATAGKEGELEYVMLYGTAALSEDQAVAALLAEEGWPTKTRDAQVLASELLGTETATEIITLPSASTATQSLSSQVVCKLTTATRLLTASAPATTPLRTRIGTPNPYADGTQIERMSVKWITQDSLVLGDQATEDYLATLGPTQAAAIRAMLADSTDPSAATTGDTDNDTLYVRATDSTGKPSDSKPYIIAQVDYALSGEHDYASGDVRITVPAHIVRGRNGNFADSFVIPLPESPKTGSDFNWELTTDAQGNEIYVLTNTRTLSAATKGFVQFGITGFAPHAVVDMAETDPFEAAIEVTTNKGNEISQISNQIKAAFDTQEIIDEAYKLAIGQASVVKASELTLPAGAPTNFTTEGFDGAYYVVINWGVRVQHKGNQEYVITACDRMGTDEGTFAGSGFVIAAGTKSDTMATATGAANESALTTTYKNGYNLGTLENGYSKDGYTSYYYVRTAYPLTDANIAQNKVHQFQNQVDFTLVEKDHAGDPASERAYYTTTASATANATFEWHEPRFKEPYGHFNVFKWGNDGESATTKNGLLSPYLDHSYSSAVGKYGDSNFNPKSFYNGKYPYDHVGLYLGALNKLSTINGLPAENVEVAYTVESDAYTFPWTYQAPANATDKSPRLVENYSKKNVTMQTYDTGLVFDGTKLNPLEDYAYKKLYIPRPLVGYAQATGMDATGEFVKSSSGGFSDGGFNYYEASDYSNIQNLKADGTPVSTGAAEPIWVDMEVQDANGAIRWINNYAKLDYRNTAFSGTDAAITYYYDENGTQLATPFETTGTTVTAVTAEGALAESLPAVMTNFRTHVSTNKAYYHYYVLPTIELFASGAAGRKAQAAFGSESAKIYAPQIDLVNNIQMQAFAGNDTSATNIFDKTNQGTDVLGGYRTDSLAIPQKDGKAYAATQQDQENGYVRLHYTATMEFQSFVPNKKLYAEAQQEGNIPQVTGGTFYDLLPPGVIPDLESIKLAKGDTVLLSYTMPNYKNSGRTMLVVKIAIGSGPVEYVPEGFSTGFWETKPTLDFDARYDLVSLKDYGEDLHNVVAFEADVPNMPSGRSPYVGTLEGYKGEADDPAGTENKETKAATVSEAERRALANLNNSEDDDPVFLYAGTWTTVKAPVAASTDLSKMLSTNGDGIWSTGKDPGDVRSVYEDGTYSYRLRVGSGADSLTSNIILYDTLESYMPGMFTNDQDENAHTPQWHGELTGVDVTQLEAAGVAPVVYYSTTKVPASETMTIYTRDENNNVVQTSVSGADVQSGFQIAAGDHAGVWSDPGCGPTLAEYDAANPKKSQTVKTDYVLVKPNGSINTAVWTRAEDFSGNLADVTMVAIDARAASSSAPAANNSNGRFVLRPEETLVAYLHMHAPKETDDPNDRDSRYYIAHDAHAFNNVYLSATTANVDDPNSVEDQPVRHDYTKVGLKEHRVFVSKVWKDDNNRDGKRSSSVIMRLFQTDPSTGTTRSMNKAIEVLEGGYYVLDAAGQRTGELISSYRDFETNEIIAYPAWSGAFTAIPFANTNGVPFVYSIQEDPVANIQVDPDAEYIATVQPLGDDNFRVTNTHEPVRISVAGEKSWQGDSDEDLLAAFGDPSKTTETIRPSSVVVELYSNGYSKSTKTVQPNAEGVWTYSFDNLYKYESGREIDYTVKERISDPNYIPLYYDDPSELAWTEGLSAAQVGRAIREGFYTTSGGEVVALNLKTAGRYMCNYYHPFGDVTLFKQVVGGNAATQGQKFAFEVLFERPVQVEEIDENGTLTGNTTIVLEPSLNEYSYKVFVANGTSTLADDVQATSGGQPAEGTATSGSVIELESGQYLRFYDLPEGMVCTFAEREQAGYTPTEGETQSVTVKANRTLSNVKAAGVDKLVYTNDYLASGRASLAANKQLHGKKLQNNYDFSFALSLVELGADGQLDTADDKISPIRTGYSRVDADADATDLETFASVSFGSLSYSSDPGKGTPADATAGKCIDNGDGSWTYTYEITENNGGRAGYTYDTARLRATVLVRDMGNGTMETALSYARYNPQANGGEGAWEAVASLDTPTAPEEGASAEDLAAYNEALTAYQAAQAQLTFNNSYNAQGEVVFRAWKSLAGRPLQNEEFTFDLYNRNGTVAATSKNAENGLVAFSPISFNTEKLAADETSGACSFDAATRTWTYYFVARERAGNDDTVNYDASAFGYKLHVQDNGAGGYTFTQSYVDATNAFEDCAVCEGTGKAEGQDCETCKGSGLVGNPSWDPAETDAPPVFKNTLKDGKLAITKLTEWENGATPNEHQQFHFRVKLLGEDVDRIASIDYKIDPNMTNIGELSAAGSSSASAASAASIASGVLTSATGEDLASAAGAATSTNSSASSSPEATSVHSETPASTGEESATVAVETIASAATPLAAPLRAPSAGATLLGTYYVNTSSTAMTVDSSGNLQVKVYDTGEVELEMKSGTTSIKYLNLGNLLTNVQTEIKTTNSGFSFANCGYAKVSLSGPVKVVADNSEGRIKLGSALTASLELEGLSYTSSSSNIKAIFATLFQGSTNLTNIDFGSTLFSLSNNFASVTLSSAFYGCTSLTSLTLPEIIRTDGSSVPITLIANMFYNCNKLASITVPSSKYVLSGASPTNMFYGCKALSVSELEATLANIDFSDVGTSMYRMFYNCTGLKGELHFPSSFDTSKVTNMEAMFYNCGMTSIDLSGFDTSNVTNMKGMFYNCSSLTSVDLSNLDTSKVTTMYEMFRNCIALTSLELNPANTSNVTNIGRMFQNCTSLTTPALEAVLAKFVTTNVTAMHFFVSGCTELRGKLTFPVSFTTANVTNMNAMFEGCGNIDELDISSFDMGKVTACLDMFGKCYPNCFYRVTVGDKFNFRGNGSIVTSSAAKWPDPWTPKGSTSNANGKWVLLDAQGEYTDFIYTATELRDRGEVPAGTYAWYEEPATFMATDTGAAAGTEILKETFRASQDYVVPNVPAEHRYYNLDQDSPFLYWKLSDANNAAKINAKLGASEQLALNQDGDYALYPGFTIPAESFDVGAAGQTIYVKPVYFIANRTATVTNGEFDLYLQGGWKATVDGLPANTAYQVWEETPTGWELVAQSGTSGIIQPLETAQASFTNRYAPGSTSAQFTAVKTLDGVAPDAGAFSFELCPSSVSGTPAALIATSNMPMPEGTTGADAGRSCTLANATGGFVQFDSIKYEHAGTYTYTLSEVLPANASESGIAYDTRTWTITVVVTDDGAGNLSAATTYACGAETAAYASFANETMPGSLKLTKLAEAGSATTANEDDIFTFRVRFYNENGIPFDSSTPISWHAEDENGNVVLPDTPITPDDPDPIDPEPPADATWTAFANNGSTISYFVSSDGTLWIKPTVGTTGTLNISSAVGSALGGSSVKTVRVVNPSENSIVLDGQMPASNYGSDSPFTGWSAIENFYGEGFDVSSRTSLQSLFRGLPLQTVNLSTWDVSNVTDFSRLFQGAGYIGDDASKMLTVDLSSWGSKTSNATALNHMFQTGKAQSVNLSGWNVEKVTTTQQMFQDCSNLEEVNIDGWSTVALTNNSMMFGNGDRTQTPKLWKLVIGDSLKVANASNMNLNNTGGDKNWRRVSDGAGPYTSYGLFNLAPANRAGTWVWNTNYDTEKAAWDAASSTGTTQDSESETQHGTQSAESSYAALVPQAGEVTITLKAGHTAFFDNLPAGTRYEIVESDLPAGWTLTENGIVSETGAVDVGSGTIDAAGMDTATATNRYDAAGVASLAAHKRLLGDQIVEGQFSFELLALNAEGTPVADAAATALTAQNGALDNEASVVDEEASAAATTAAQAVAAALGEQNQDENAESTAIVVTKDNPYQGTAPARFTDMAYTLQGARIDAAASPARATAVVRDDNGAWHAPESGEVPNAWVYRYLVREQVPDDAVAEDGTTYIAAKAAGTLGQTGYTVFKKGTIAYDATDRYASVLVYDAGHGRLAADASYDAVAADPTAEGSADVFENRMLPGSLEVSKTLVGATEAAASTPFNFAIELTDAAGNALAGPFDASIANADGSQSPVAGGVASGQVLQLQGGQTLHVDGLPHGTIYRVAEAATQGFTLAGITDDDGATITESSTAEGSVTANKTAQVHFENAYAASGRVSLRASKTLAVPQDLADTKGLKAGQFAFTIFDEDYNPIQQVANAAPEGSAENVGDGLVTSTAPVVFDPLSYTADDDGQTFVYYLAEENDGQEKIVYSKALYKVVVVPHDLGNGSMDCTVSYYRVAEDGTETLVNDPEDAAHANDVPSFENSYNNEQTGELEVSKQVLSHQASDFARDFYFRLTLADPAASPSASNADPADQAASSGDPADPADSANANASLASATSAMPTFLQAAGGKLYATKTFADGSTSKMRLVFDRAGQATFTLQHGEKLQLADLPVGTRYVVEEIDDPTSATPLHDTFTVTYEVSAHEAGNNSAAVTTTAQVSDGGVRGEITANVTDVTRVKNAIIFELNMPSTGQAGLAGAVLVIAALVVFLALCLRRRNQAHETKGKVAK